MRLGTDSHSLFIPFSCLSSQTYFLGQPYAIQEFGYSQMSWIIAGVNIWLVCTDAAVLVTANIKR